MIFRVFVICLLLSGCGFTPAIDGATAKKLADVQVMPMADRQGQIMRTALRRALNPNNAPVGGAYEFSGTVTSDAVASFTQTTGTYRGRLTFSITGKLQSRSGQTLWQGTVSRSSLLALEEQPSLSQDAIEALWPDLAAQLAQDLKLRFAAALK